jgi:hypothetical protein
LVDDNAQSGKAGEDHDEGHEGASRQRGESRDGDEGDEWQGQ